MMFTRESLTAATLLAVSVMLGCGKSVSGSNAGGSGDSGGGGDTGGGGVGATQGDGGNAAAGESGQGNGGNGNPSGGQGGGQAGGGKGGAGTGGAMGGQTGTGGAGGVSASGGQGGGVPSNLEPCATHPYCNDFENTPVGERPKGFINVSTGNTMAVAEDKFFSGKRSLAITAVSDAARYSVYLHDRFTNPKRVGYARMMVWLENVPPASGSSHWNMISMSGQTKIPQGNASAGIAFGGTGGNASNWYLYGGSAGGNQDCTKSVSPPQFPLKQWACVEFKVDETTTSNYQVWINKKEITQLSLKWNATGASCVGGASNIWYIPDVETFGFGWQHYHDQTAPIKMWIDDVVVDEKPIGCPN